MITYSATKEKRKNMTKQDSAMEQHTSKQQDSGKTDSNIVPHWHMGPKELSRKEALRRRYKKFFGFKPCNVSEEELELIISAKEADLENRRPRSLVDPKERATIGDALHLKR